MADRIVVQAPASKSATQRALLLAALAKGTSVLHHPLDCEDTRVFSRALADLGIGIEYGSDHWTVHGGRFQAPSHPLFCGKAGSSFRFLAALAPLFDTPIILDADEQLKKRPQHDVLHGLHSLGLKVVCLDREGYPPFRILPSGPRARSISLDASRTSQFLSGLLMVAPTWGGLEIALQGDVISRPYVDLTLTMLKRFSGPQIEERTGGFSIPSGSYTPRDIRIEGDWSAGATLLVAAELTQTKIDVPNLDPSSTQGDRVILDFLDTLKKPGPHTFDLSTCPDLITPLAVACAFADSPSVLRNVEHARIKESDRIAASSEMLMAVGVKTVELPDGLRIEPSRDVHPARIEDYGDHRVAMAAGLLALRIPGTTTAHPPCVAKSFPNFWNVLEAFPCT